MDRNSLAEERPYEHRRAEAGRSMNGNIFLWVHEEKIGIYSH
jgi:hypothetical protein